MSAWLVYLQSSPLAAAVRRSIVRPQSAMLDSTRSNGQRSVCPCRGPVPRGTRGGWRRPESRDSSTPSRKSPWFNPRENESPNHPKKISSIPRMFSNPIPRPYRPSLKSPSERDNYPSCVCNHLAVGARATASRQFGLKPPRFTGRQGGTCFPSRRRGMRRKCVASGGSSWAGCCPVASRWRWPRRKDSRLVLVG